MWALNSSEQLSSGTHCQGSSAALIQPPDEAEEGWSHHLGRDGPAVVRVPWSAPALHGHPPHLAPLPPPPQRKISGKTERKMWESTT